jgi:sRNA-binding regulator protein Hfq
LVHNLIYKNIKGIKMDNASKLLLSAIYICFFSSIAIAQIEEPTNEQKIFTLAEKKFDTLFNVDRKLFRAVASGERADFSSINEEENDPAGADKWRKKRIIRAKIIEWLCTDRNAKDKISHKGIMVKGARIDGVLNLADARIPFSLSFIKCAFPDTILLGNAVVQTLNLEGTHSGAIEAYGLKVEGSVYLRDGFRAEGEVSLRAAKISGQLDCTNGQFINRKGMAIDGDAMQVGASVFLRDGFKAEGEVRLRYAHISGQLDCDSGEFINPMGTAIDGAAMQVGADVLLRRSFEAKGKVSLLLARISGRLACDSGQFINPGKTAIDGDAMEVASSVFLRNGFKAEGEVNLVGAKISGQLDCRDGQFINADTVAINGSGMQVGWSVYLRRGFRAEGEVVMSGVKISGQLACDSGQFINPGKTAINGNAMEVGGHVILRDSIKVVGEVDLQTAIIGGGLQWRAFVSPENTTLDLRSCKIGILDDDSACWPSKGRLHLHGLTYNSLGDNAPKNAESRIEWLNRQPEDQFRPQPYEQLAKILRETGRDEDAKKIMIAKNWEQIKSGEMPFYTKLWRRIMGLTIGFGYRPMRVLWLILLIVALGVVCFERGSRAKMMTPVKQGGFTNTDAQGNQQLSEDYPQFYSIIYSIDLFVPLVDLHQASYWMPTGSALLSCYMWFHIIMGWILTTLLVVGLTGVLKT